MFHVHITLAHFPCALFALSLILFFVGEADHQETLGPSALVCLIAAVVSVPLTALTGIWSWRRRRTTGESGVFPAKMLLAGLLLVAGLSTLLPALRHDEVRPGDAVGLFLCVWLVALLAHCGGRIVFRRIGLEPPEADGDDEDEDDENDNTSEEMKPNLTEE